MIEEVNGASATLSKTNRADEPVSKLTSHDIELTLLLTMPIDLPNRSHPQLTPVPTAGH